MKKIAKRIVAWLCSLSMILSMMATVYASGTQIEVGTSTFVQGIGNENVEIPLTLTGNTGIAGMTLTVEYTDGLILTDVKTGTGLGKLAFTPPGDLTANPFNMVWDGLVADSTNGDVAVLTFSVPKETVKKYSITVKTKGVFDNDLNDIDILVSDGEINVTEKPKENFVGLSLSDKEYTYDGAAKALAVSGAPADATVTYTCSNFDDNGKAINVGTYNITATVKKDGYNDWSDTKTLTITPKALTVTGLSAQSKVYDGTDKAVLSGGVLNGVVAGDDVSAKIPIEGKFDDKNVGKNKAVTFDELILSGEAAGNYTLTQPAGLKASITQKEIFITADNKTMRMDGAIPELTYTVDGLCGDDKLNGKPETKANGTQVGDFDILQGTLTAGDNYKINFTKGTLTVTDKKECGENLYWTLDDEGLLTISGTGDMYNYSEENPAPWKDELNKVSEIIIEDGVTSIGDYAFYPYFGRNVELTVPESLKSIGDNAIIKEQAPDGSAYGSCSVSLIRYSGAKEDFANITIGEGNTGLDGADKYYQKVKTPVSDEYINDEGAKSGITWVLDSDGTLTVSGEGDIPWYKLGGLYIGGENYYEFYEDAVKKIVVEEGITGIDNFAYFENLEEVSLPSTLKTISQDCFACDSKLNHITIPDKTEVIEESAFWATGIEKLQIPESVKNIEGNLVSYTPLYKNESNWENGALYIDNWLIATKEGLTEIFEVKPGTIGIAGESIRKEMTAVIIPETVKYIGDCAFTDYEGNELSIPDGVLEIGCAFFFSGAKSVYIPKSVTYIDSGAFDHAKGDIYYEGTEEEWNSIFTPSEWFKSVVNYNTEAVTISVGDDFTGGSVSGNGKYLKGATVTLTATPESGYKFSGWYNGSTVVSTNDSYTFAAESDMTLIAKFTKKSTGGGGGGGGGSTTTASYTVTFETNGGSKVSSVSVEKNAKATAPTAPTKDGFEFAGWYSDKDLKTKYDFSEKVTKNITLYAAWTEKTEVKDGTTEQATPETTVTFADVAADAWFADNVKYVFENGLMSGVTSTEFAPNNKLTRAMLVAILYRAEGSPEVDEGVPFEDVKANDYFANAVVWAERNAIVSGVNGNEFAPDENITREQIATIIYRYAQYKGYDTSAAENTNILSYADYDEISEYAISAMQYAVGSGLIKGKTEITLNPLDTATRAEIAAILQRFIEANK